MTGGISSGRPVSHTDADQDVERLTEARNKVAGAAKQEASIESFQKSCEEAVPGGKPGGTEKQKKVHQARVKKAMSAGDKQGPKIRAIQQKTADDFQERNPELKSTTLILLRSAIKPDDSAEEILKKVRDHFGDVSLADEALDFLLLTTEGDLHNKVKEAKAQFNELMGREIAAGRNIAAEARAAAQEGLGTPTNMRNMYRDVTGNPPDANTLFNELSVKYLYKSLIKVTNFLLHAAGADMNAKGPSIPRGELHNILTEIRTIQAILGVYRFFNGRMKLVRNMMAKADQAMPKELNFENLSKCFMSLIAERYPNSDKVMQQGRKLGVDGNIQSEIVAFSQFRDAVRQVSLNLIYRSVEHRDTVSDAIIGALDDLEDQVEEMLEAQNNKDGVEPMDVD